MYNWTLWGQEIQEVSVGIVSRRMFVRQRDIVHRILNKSVPKSSFGLF